jgi:hypothetical protein
MDKTISQPRMSLLMPSHVLRAVPVLLILLTGCGSSLKLTSDWQQGEMNIDGSDSEWQRGLYYDKESDFVYGVRNDDQYVYIFLKTQNRSTQMQIMRQGLTVWFDREDGKNQTFGIQYPMSRKEPHAVSASESSEETVQSFPGQEFPELEILGPAKGDVQRFSTLDAPGIRVKLGRTRETLVYELRVPIKKTPAQPFAIEPASSNRIGIKFETGEFNSGSGKSGKRAGGGHDPGEGMGEENPAEGNGFGGRRFQGGGDQEGRFGPMEKTKRLELWLSVQMAHS